MATQNKVTRNKRPVTKGFQREPVKWVVIHPKGHIYVVPNLDRIKMTYGFSKEQMEEIGWSFEPKYEN